MDPYYSTQAIFEWHGRTQRRFYLFPFSVNEDAVRRHLRNHSAYQDSKFFPHHEGGWAATFKFEGFQFLVDVHEHSTTTSFAIDDAHCPDVILTKLMGSFVPVLTSSLEDDDMVRGIPPQYFTRQVRVRSIFRYLALAIAAVAILGWIALDNPKCALAAIPATILIAASFAVDTGSILFGYSVQPLKELTVCQRPARPN